MKIAKLNNPINNQNSIVECWLTGNRKVMLKDKSIVLASDIVVGDHVWDMDGIYLGECIELAEYDPESEEIK